MADLKRIPKPIDQWSRYEFSAYNVRCETQDALTFFGMSELPDPDVDPVEILALNKPKEATTREGYAFIHKLLVSMSSGAHHARTVVDFTYLLLDACSFSAVGKELRTMVNIPFTVCGETIQAALDVSLWNINDEIIFIARENEGSSVLRTGEHYEAPLLALAVAAFAHNHARRSKLGLPLVDSQVIHAIAMARQSSSESLSA